MNLLITICARGGSKGIPGKNIKNIAGKPLIVYSIKTAILFSEKYNADIILSTDSDQIKFVASKEGLDTSYIRPAETATDFSGKAPAIDHARLYMEKRFSKTYDYVLDLDVTSPLRTISDLEEAFDLLKNDVNAINIISVSPCARNPYFNMLEKKENGYYSLIKSLEKPILSRQKAPEVYDMNASFYFYKRSYFEKPISTITKKSMIYEIKHVCFDLDNPIDFEFMEFLILNKKLDFDL